MNDQAIMENLLMTTKGVCDLYMHGAVESSTQNVHQAFDAALSDSVCMQGDIYKQMEANLTENAANVYLQDLADLVAVRKGLEGVTFYPIYVLDLSGIRFAQ